MLSRRVYFKSTKTCTVLIRGPCHGVKDWRRRRRWRRAAIYRSCATSPTPIYRCCCCCCSCCCSWCHRCCFCCCCCCYRRRWRRARCSWRIPGLWAAASAPRPSAPDWPNWRLCKSATPGSLSTINHVNYPIPRQLSIDERNQFSPNLVISISAWPNSTIKIHLYIIYLYYTCYLFTIYYYIHHLFAIDCLLLIVLFIVIFIITIITTYFSLLYLSFICYLLSQLSFFFTIHYYNCYLFTIYYPIYHLFTCIYLFIRSIYWIAEANWSHRDSNEGNSFKLTNKNKRTKDVQRRRRFMTSTSPTVKCR